MTLPFTESLFTHDQLVAIARDWLKKQRCSVVTSEICAGGWEQPDAIGWRNSQTTLVECKTSRSDFLADKKKPFRSMEASGVALGNYRYYLTAPNVIRDESELLPCWGWLEIGTRDKVVCRRKAEFCEEKHQAAETRILLSLLRRIGRNCGNAGVTSIQFYTYETKNRAVLEVAVDKNELINSAK